MEPVFGPSGLQEAFSEPTTCGRHSEVFKKNPCAIKSKSCRPAASSTILLGTLMMLAFVDPSAVSAAEHRSGHDLLALVEFRAES